jgi:hypothetical protein
MARLTDQESAPPRTVGLPRAPAPSTAAPASPRVQVHPVVVAGIVVAAVGSVVLLGRMFVNSLATR